MYNYSTTSLLCLETCHKDLKVIAMEIIKVHDCSILCGYRGKHEQNEKFRFGLSKKQFPNSKHNHKEGGVKQSLAIDMAPYIKGIGVKWPDLRDGLKIYSKQLGRFYVFAGIVLGIAAMKNIKLRWGGDWDMDTDIMNNQFDDLVHFELYNDKYK